MTKSTTNDFIIISWNEKKLYDSKILLWWQDAENLLEYQDVFMKFLDKSKLSYQIELSQWTYRGQEEKLYRSMETIEELKNWLKSIETWFKQYNLQKEKK